MHTHHPVGRRPQWAGAQEHAVCGLLLPGGPLLPGQGARPGAAPEGEKPGRYMWDSLLSLEECGTLSPAH